MEISFNLKNGFSIEAGECAEIGVGGNFGLPLKIASVGFYSTFYGSFDTRSS